MSDPDGVIPYPGHTSDMADGPRNEMRDSAGRGLLDGKRALITGGDSGIALAQSLSDRRIRVNCVAPGPARTPLILTTMDAERVESFGGRTPFGRAAQPAALRSTD